MLQKEQDMKKLILSIEERYNRMIATIQSEQSQKNRGMKEISPRKSESIIQIINNVETASFTPLRKQRVSYT